MRDLVMSIVIALVLWPQGLYHLFTSTGWPFFVGILMIVTSSSYLFNSVRAYARRRSSK
ncbi:hypothetical protein [Paenibacillus sp.]|uniref:hypothetical protein n=1 Tax=Paenibacillus sp. TaxID=58172 RepID=UPI002D2863B3|nr:hypothetical protein [Paenibacillus sp.]HZG83608.1 hypothetical protein [Paenibacillus sp.]